MGESENKKKGGGIRMNRIKFWISKFICKWSDFAGMGNDKDILELKKSIKAYENGIAKRKDMEVIIIEQTKL